MMRGLAAFGCLFLMLGGAASAQPAHSNLGTLTCTVAEAKSDKPDASSNAEERAVHCTFKPAAGAAEETYVGVISEVGGGELPDAKSVLIWAVNGREGAAAAHGLLSQTYVGEPKEAGSDDAASTLKGQSDSSITLRSSTPSGGPAPSGLLVLRLSLRSVPA